MASKLSRTIGNATQLNHVGRLRYFVRSIYGKNLDTSILGIGSNRKWRRVKRDLHRQVESLGFYDLNTLVAPDQRNIVYDDFIDLLDCFGEAKALEIMRNYIVENYLCTQLVILAVDFTAPLKVNLFEKLAIVNLGLEKEKREKQELAKKLQRSFRAANNSPIIQLPLVAPNAPNTLPAFSLAAA
jgi:hypothetical protein